VSPRHLEHPAADVLRVLAVSRSTGALEIRGAPGGTIFLHDGDVTFAEAPGAPRVPEPDTTGRRAFVSAVRDAVLETGLILLTAPPGGERPLFRPGRSDRTGAACRFGVDAVLAEVERRAAGLADLGVAPDAGLRLRGLRRGRSVVLTADQWALVAAFDGVETPRRLAWRSGRSLSATVSAIAALVRDGAVAPAEPAPGPPVTPATAPSPFPPTSPLPLATPDAATPDAATPGPVTPEPANPAPATPDRATPGLVTPAETPSGLVTPDLVTPAQAPSGPVTPGRATPGRATPGRAMSVPAASGPVTQAPEPWAPEPRPPEPWGSGLLTPTLVLPDPPAPEPPARAAPEPRRVPAAPAAHAGVPAQGPDVPADVPAPPPGVTTALPRRRAATADIPPAPPEVWTDESRILLAERLLAGLRRL
jgi:hypothetical protein